MSPNDSCDIDECQDKQEGGLPVFPDHFVKEAAVIALVVGLVIFV